MELTLGSHVREHGQRVGRLAGFELEPASHSIRRIIFSPDGHLGPQAMMRPISSISVTRSGVELRSETNPTPLPAVRDVLLLSRATRLTRDGREQGRLVAVEVDPESRRMLSVSGRQHWFTGRFRMAAAEVDCSTPGEIRIAHRTLNVEPGV